MIEFAAAVAALGTLMLGTISVVGMQEVQRRGIVAAREAAFQAVWARQRLAPQTLRERISGEHYDDAALVNATGTDRLLRPDDIQLTMQRTAAPGRGAAAIELLFRPLRAAGGFLGNDFDLADDGFQSGVISARLGGTERLPAPFGQLQLRFEQPYALLGDDWSASGPAHVRQRVAGLVPAHVLTPIAAVWRPLAAPLSLFEPSIGDLCLGLIEPDRIPEDRLGPGPSPRNPACR